MQNVVVYILVAVYVSAGIVTANLIKNAKPPVVQGEVTINTCLGEGEATDEQIEKCTGKKPTPKPKPTPKEETVKPMMPDMEKQIEIFLAKRDSPIKAKDYMDAADEYGLDPRVLVAIGQQESQSGKHCFRPYNCWGLMTKTQFKSYREGIFFLARLISKRSDDSVSDIARWYNPGNSKDWARKVKIIMNQI